MIKRGERVLKNKHSQVWVETVIYTLIGLTLMGVIIGAITPQINKMVDRSVITQTEDSMNTINQQIVDTLSSAGSQRELSLSVKRGEYMIDSTGNKFYFILRDTSLLMSQPGEPIKSGELTILTTPRGSKKYDISIMLNYASLGLNLTYNGKDVNKTFTKAPSPYRLLIINKDGASRQIDLYSIGGI